MQQEDILHLLESYDREHLANKPVLRLIML